MPEKKSGELNLILDTSLYPVEAIQAAAYTLTDRAYVRIERRQGTRASVCLKPKKGGNGWQPNADEFYNELLHQALRLKVSGANQKIREYIVTKALVSALPASELPAVEASCSQCPPAPQAPQGAPVDEELEKEIDKLLAEIEKGGAAGDPLGVAVPWEDKYGEKGKKGVPPVQEPEAKGLS